MSALVKPLLGSLVNIGPGVLFLIDYTCTNMFYQIWQL